MYHPNAAIMVRETGSEMETEIRGHWRYWLLYNNTQEREKQGKASVGAVLAQDARLVGNVGK